MPRLRWPAMPEVVPDSGCAPPLPDLVEEAPSLESLSTLKPLGQIREFVHPGSERRWAVDRGPARRARARAV